MSTIQASIMWDFCKLRVAILFIDKINSRDSEKLVIVFENQPCFGASMNRAIGTKAPPRPQD